MKYDFEFKRRAVREVISIHPQILEDKGRKRFAVLPYDQFQSLMEELADYEDLRILREAKSKEKNTPGIGLDELKTRLGIKNGTRRSSRRHSK